MNNPNVTAEELAELRKAAEGDPVWPDDGQASGVADRVDPASLEGEALGEEEAQACNPGPGLLRKRPSLSSRPYVSSSYNG